MREAHMSFLPSLWNKRPLLPVLAFAVLDTVCIAAAFGAAIMLSRSATSSEKMLYLFLFVLMWYGAAAGQRLLVSRRADSLLAQLFSITKAFLITLMLSILLMGILTRGRLGREFLFMFGMGSFMLILSYRTMLRLSLWGLRLRGRDLKHVLIIGANEASVQLVRIMRAHSQYGFHIEGFLEDEPQRAAIIDKYDVPYLGKIHALEQLLIDRVIDGVYIALPLASSYEISQRIAHLCEGVGVPVRLVSDLFPRRVTPNSLWRIEGIPLLSLSAPSALEPRFLVQRAGDCMAATLLLTVLSPFLLLIAVLVKMDSPGPVFSCQQRIRRDGRTFQLLRFRSTVWSRDPHGAPAGTSQTRVGGYLRKYDLDELPHLFNVWRGHMSLAGPLPRAVSSLDDSGIGRWRGQVEA